MTYGESAEGALRPVLYMTARRIRGHLQHPPRTRRRPGEGEARIDGRAFEHMESGLSRAAHASPVESEERGRRRLPIPIFPRRDLSNVVQEPNTLLRPPRPLRERSRRGPGVVVALRTHPSWRWGPNSAWLFGVECSTGFVSPSRSGEEGRGERWLAVKPPARTVSGEQVRDSSSCTCGGSDPRGRGGSTAETGWRCFWTNRGRCPSRSAGWRPRARGCWTSQEPPDPREGGIGREGTTFSRASAGRRKGIRPPRRSFGVAAKGWRAGRPGSI